MATKRILRLTNQEALIKVDGTVGSVTIDLDVDLKLATETISGTPKVNILAMQVSGKTGAVLSVARNGVNLWDLQANAGQLIDLQNIGLSSDATESTSDIVVTSSGAEGQLILKVRKAEGFRTQIRPAETGSSEPVV